MMKKWETRKVTIVFHCADVRATIDEFQRRGVKIVMKPTDMEFGVFAAFEDPDGNQFCMTTQELAEHQTTG